MSRKIRIKDYVCGGCFERPKDCTCGVIPWTLIMIDEKLQYAIRNLNKKGHITQACCEGHFDKGKTQYMYISFRDKHEPPMGWKSDRQNIYYKLDAKTKEGFIEQQNAGIKLLNTWVENLENYRR